MDSLKQSLAALPVPRPAAAGAPGPSGEALGAIRAPVRDDLIAVDACIRARLKSAVPLVDQIAEHIIGGGGKRLRPLLVLLAARAAQSGPAAAVAASPEADHVMAATFIEFIHTATLLHDDVVDNSSRRRGRLTANEMFGNQASVLVGDFVYSRAFQMMAAVESTRVIEIMANATNVIAEGEVLQLMNARDADTTEERYLQVIDRKTAQLFQAGAEVAAVLAGATPTVQRALADYGRHLGIAYQLVDDAMDYQSDPDTRGKNLGDDLAEGKPTLPLIHALREAEATARKGGSSPEGQRAQATATAIRDAIATGGLDKLELIFSAIESLGGLQYTARLAAAEAEKAQAALTALHPSPYRDGLAALARFAIERTH